MGDSVDQSFRRSAASVATNTPERTGQSFVATVRLTNRRGTVLAEAGATCEQVPAESLGWLLAQGLIASVN